MASHSLLAWHATKGHANGNSTTWSNTHVTAGDTLAIELGADMNLNGRLRPASDGLKGLTSRTQLEMINQHISILRIRPGR
ncbi:hemagglutinin repeat-containing protein [Burkholderia vietnamiensis]|jgi:hypothetical protein|nr:hemagglutinin repeat-containing protein [Burkholderia vietnamiensis]QMI50075.1 hypothetical protein MBR110_31905 [Burkholderia sp. MBR-1]MBR8217556.1 hemagglutinin repeat-containing protein [Burkholderia vietnamiensis]MBR8231720.1 hemagglutinin repeat-containing protein [Burkholderia vietnamiensis]MCA7986273.1 hemagglutinin repeat-containing protein [Burkholderia vietnamiensis]MCA8149068.1 hemagglutinin repeat-containing protein [Burkholderia vietnamiensis]